jgi:hypothetical protein
MGYIQIGSKKIVLEKNMRETLQGLSLFAKS